MAPGRFWRCRELHLPVFDRVHVMGILNVTPDSFSDGGLYRGPEAAVQRALEMVEEGADIVDVGGESTRPGAQPVEAAEEMERVVPVLEALSAARTPAAISVDTSKAAVARAACAAGAHIINDVSALGADPEMAAVAAESGAGVVLMHMKGEPRTMQQDPRYDDVVAEVRAELLDRAARAEKAGVGADSICIDPGIGFGKTADHNLALLRNAGVFAAAGYPCLFGPSRKSFIGATLGLEVHERMAPTAAAVALLVAAGVQVVRVHDVKEMVQVVRMTEAILDRR